ncbi:alpha/beta fold hydrolase [Clostridium sp. 'White wine YQ']|uniref:alpha/beta fold hydrolase n=1 Tax=Clostridium sp. 'White wine YQ' TaxID=3027474 RepID=UPI0023663641|nr:alpha/beta hydrolase [Clostridium sp. 'White wine YQ']MDD7793469.1 alpha/beta hydrolase [Clostridium sp. 'White wine YQ']
MITKDKNIECGYVTTEGDNLYYEVRGNGKTLLLIPAGEGKYYSGLADILSNEYKVITYDRRANGRSTINDPQNFEIGQQSRDAVAILHAVGEESSFVFGNSAGAVIALDMAKTYPGSVLAVIAHEAPMARMHPEAPKWQRFFARVYLTAFRFGSTVASLRFMFGAQVPVIKMIKASKKAEEYIRKYNSPTDEHHKSSNNEADIPMKLELLQVTNYMPDVERLKKSGVKVFMAVGEWSLNKKTWYAISNKVLAEKLECELVTFPGHHGSLADMPDEWALTLRNILHKVEY